MHDDNISAVRFEKSEAIGALAKALAEFQGDITSIGKDGTNPHFKSKFATLGKIIETIKEPLSKKGLSFMQFPDGDGLTTIIMHTSGEWIRSTANLHLAKMDPQGQGSAITYMRRYALSGGLGLSTDDDDDGNAASKPAPKVTYQQRKVEPEDRPAVDIAPDEGVDIGAAVPDDVGKQKALIVKLLKKRNPKLDTKVKKNVEGEIADLTGLALVEQNFPEIIRQLSAI